jgi:P-type Cu+ transporter
MVKHAATADMLCSAAAEQSDLLPAELGALPWQSAAGEGVPCFHCGTACASAAPSKDDKHFCCHGCLTVFELLTENGLDGFYALNEPAGVKGGGPADPNRFAFLDAAVVRERLVDFADDRLTRVTFHVPAIHCVACVWLLENLFRLRSGLGHSQVNFPRKEVAIAFETGAIRLSEVVALLTSLGYEPDLKLSDVAERPQRANSRRLWIQAGVAGFAFGNIMLFSISSYLGLDSMSGPGFRKLVGWLSLGLALPVVIYSASDYWRAAWTSLRQRLLNIDVPIAAGVFAIFAQSCYEVLSGRGEGYFDSLTGLLFFLLCGKIFQQKTFDRLAFDRDYRSFFPLSVKRVCDGREELVAVSQLAVGDKILIRNGELIPADATLLEGHALIDYSFVTGESEPVEKQPGDHVYAGGRQVGSAITLQTTKTVSQGYLTSLWNQDAFRKREIDESLNSLTNRYSQRFTKIVMGVAVGAALFWAFVNPVLSVKSFTSVLIVACPCALALAAPFALGTAHRVLAARNVFLRNGSVLETLAVADTVVFDKTGTLTTGGGALRFRGTALSSEERDWLYSLSRHSVHPCARRFQQAFSANGSALAVENFREIPGRGMEGRVGGCDLWVGSAEWLWSRGVQVLPHSSDATAQSSASGTTVHVAINGEHRGFFDWASAVRPDTGQLMAHLGQEYTLALLSGDNDRDRERFRQLLGPSAQLHFDQSPAQKLAHIRELQAQGRKVIMVGDGLNDAGALKQSDTGIAVVEKLSTFSPASDVIAAAEMVPHLGQVTRFSKLTVRVVRGSFLRDLQI